jgi:hypothetical protein
MIRLKEVELRYFLEGEFEIFGDFIFDEKFNNKEIRILIKEESSMSDNN